MRASICIRRGGLGDTLLMIPVLRAMRALAPAARLTFAGVTDFASLLLRHGVVDAVRSSEDLGLWGLYAGGDAGGRAQRALAAFDWIVSDDPTVLRLAPGKRRVDVFDPVLAAAPPAPAAAQLLARVGLAGSAVGALRAAPGSPAAGAPIVLHPGSGSARKCWPRPALRALAQTLAALAPLRVVLGPAEIARGEAGDWPAPVVVPATIDALADAIVAAPAYVGHDSGATHLAAALGVPTVALFTTTDPRVWAPAGDHVHVVTAPPPGAIAAVVAALQRR